MNDIEGCGSVGRALDLESMGIWFEPHCRCSHCVVSMSKTFISSLVLVQPRKTSPGMTEKLLAWM